jgi:GWxTD domain-containing protein
MNNSFKYILTIIFAVLLTSACSNNYYENIDRGSGFQFEPGKPELRLAASGFINEENTPQILVTGDVVYASLIYKKRDEDISAVINIEVLVERNSESGKKTVIANQQFTETLIRNDRGAVFDQNVFRFERQFDVKPQEYKVTVSITDMSSGANTTRETAVEIPEVEDNAPAITQIRTLAKNSGEEDSQFSQVTTYDIPSQLDSLQFIFQVLKPTSKPMEVESRLIKFNSDTTASWPMSYQNYPNSSIQYQGIEYDDFEVVQSSLRNLEARGNVLIENNFKGLEEGNYRLEVIAKSDGNEEIVRARDFGIKSAYYPSLKTPKDLAAPLQYLMNDKEFKELTSISDPDSLKSSIDRFWLSNIGNSSTAKSVISMFYERVEEANKQFSNFEEGWKTDPGMVYILFGPPWDFTRYNDRMVWSYSYNLDDPEKNFVFRQPKLKNRFYPFYNFILDRSIYLNSLEYKQKERWLSGSILTRQN